MYPKTLPSSSAPTPLRSDELTNAVGLLKEELRRLDSVVLASADHNRVAAGGALAVDREAFAREITERICAHPNITVERAEADAIPDGGGRYRDRPAHERRHGC